MKNENLFIGYVYQVTEVKEVINTYGWPIKIPPSEKLFETILLKKSLDEYQDLITRKKYTDQEQFTNGFTFVKEFELTPINAILPTEEKERNLTKIKARRRFKEYQIANCKNN